MMPGGMVYGITDKGQFIVFDPANKQVFYKKDIFSEFDPTTAEQSPRIFVTGPKGEVYILFAKGAIVEVLPKTYEMKLIATAPEPIKAGGDFAHGRIFFVSSSHFMSYKL